jgi:hypothetical protein
MRTTPSDLRACTFLSLTAALIGFAGIALAQEGQPAAQPSAQPPAQPAVQPAGQAATTPQAAAAAAGLTIVKLDDTGKIVRYPEGPEEAALKIMTLTPEERTAANAVVAHRHAEVDAYVRARQPLVMRIQGINEEGLTQDRVNAFREFGREFRDFRLRDEYRTNIAKTLSPANGQIFQGLTAGYRRTWINVSQEKAKAEGKQDALAHHLNLESFTTASEEVRQSVDRQIGRSNDAILKAVETLAPTPAQQSNVPAAADFFAQAVSGAGGVDKVPAEIKVAYVRKLLSLVQIDQQRALLAAIFAEREAAEKGSAPAEAPAPAAPK